MTTFMYYGSLVLTWVFGLVVPWWAWALMGLSGAAAVWLLLPSAVSLWGVSLKLDRAHDALAAAVLAVGLVASSVSWGIEYGTAVANEGWERERAAEVRRLEEGLKAETAVEAQRANNAEDYAKFLAGELQDVLDQKSPTSEGLCPPDAIAVPRGTVDSVRSWTTRRPRSPDR